MNNFKNGALVFRIWHFDGSGELIAKTQYSCHAEDFAKMMAADDAEKRPGAASKWFYLVACEAECSVKAFRPIALTATDRAET